MQIKRVIGGPVSAWSILESEDGEVFFEDGQGYIMERSELELIAVGIMKFLSKFSDSDIEVHNHQVKVSHERAIEELDKFPNEREAKEGYCLLIRHPEQNMWKLTRVGLGNRPRTETLEDKLNKRLASIPHEFAIPAEVVKLYHLSDVHRFYHRVMDLIQHAFNERKWLEFNETDLKMFRTDNFGPKLEKLIISKREFVKF